MEIDAEAGGFIKKINEKYYLDNNINNELTD